MTEEADRFEREADEMQERSEQLADQIAETREDWQDKQRDDKVPGAAGDPDDAAERAPWPDE